MSILFVIKDVARIFFIQNYNVKGPKSNSEAVRVITQSLIKLKLMVIETWNWALNDPHSILFVIKDVTRKFSPKFVYGGPLILVKGQKNSFLPDQAGIYTKPDKNLELMSLDTWKLA